MDTDTDRSQILANFQACTDVDDIEHALAVLEQSNWNLMEAVNMLMQGQPNASAASIVVNGQGLDVTGREMEGASAAAPPFTLPDEEPLPTRTVYNRDAERRKSPAREMVDDEGITRRVICFHAQYGNTLVEIDLMDSVTVDDLKDMLSVRIDKEKNEFTIIWEDQRRVVEDNNTLRELNLPRENTLRIVSKTGSTSPQPMSCEASTSADSADSPAVNRSISDELSRVFKLMIKISLTGNNVVTKVFSEPGTKTVREVKEDMENFYDIPISLQSWDGWSSGVTDDMTLAACQLDTPMHNLSVYRRHVNHSIYDNTRHSTVVTPARRCANTQRSTVAQASTSRLPSNPTPVSESDSDHDYDMDDDDDSHDIEMAMSAPPLSNTRVPLIPAHIDDETEAVAHFNDQFISRYGGIMHPLFFSGTLKNAVQSSLHCNAIDRKLFAVYLHHDNSIAANVFCSQVLCSEAIVNYLTSNFVVWGWDLTLSTNKSRLLRAFEQVLGRNATDFLSRLKVDELPVLVVLAKVRGSLEILGVSRATVTTDEMMSTLLTAEDVFQEARNQDIREEGERREREEMKALQDAAYEESLALDRSKQFEKEKEERKKQEDEEALKLEEETMEAIKQSMASTIPDEPAADCTDTMARLRFRCPDGEMMTRRFLGHTRLETLLNYLVTKGYRTEEFKVLTTYPRRDLSLEAHSKTLEDLKLCPQETLILEAR